MKLRRIRAGRVGLVGRAARAALAALSFSAGALLISGFGVTGASAASNAKFCTDYKHAAKVSSLKDLAASLPELKKLESEAPSTMRGEIKRFTADVQLLVKNKGTFPKKSQESAFEALSTKLEAQTNKVCK